MSKRKRAIYINISIINILCWGYILEEISGAEYDYGLGMAAQLLVIGLAIRLRKVFFAREAGITPRNRTHLIVLIVLNYISLILRGIAMSLQWPVADYLIYAVLILCLVLDGVYADAILKYE